MRLFRFDRIEPRGAEWVITGDLWLAPSAIIAVHKHEREPNVAVIHLTSGYFNVHTKSIGHLVGEINRAVED